MTVWASRTRWGSKRGSRPDVVTGEQPSKRPSTPPNRRSNSVITGLASRSLYTAGVALCALGSCEPAAVLFGKSDAIQERWGPDYDPRTARGDRRRPPRNPRRTTGRDAHRTGRRPRHHRRRRLPPRRSRPGPRRAITRAPFKEHHESEDQALLARSDRTPRLDAAKVSRHHMAEGVGCLSNPPPEVLPFLSELLHPS